MHALFLAFGLLVTYLVGVGLFRLTCWWLAYLDRRDYAAFRAEVLRAEAEQLRKRGRA